jgi:UrcA family protein
MKNFILVSVAVTASAIASLALADAPQTTVVKYNDLNVTQTEGAAILYARLVSAAHQVCSQFEPTDRGAQSHMRALYASCVSKAINDAVTTVDRPALTEYAMAKNGRGAIELASR